MRDVATIGILLGALIFLLYLVFKIGEKWR